MPIDMEGHDARPLVTASFRPMTMSLPSALGAAFATAAVALVQSIARSHISDDDLRRSPVSFSRYPRRDYDLVYNPAEKWLHEV